MKMYIKATTAHDMQEALIKLLDIQIKHHESWRNMCRTQRAKADHAAYAKGMQAARDQVAAVVLIQNGTNSPLFYAEADNSEREGVV